MWEKNLQDEEDYSSESGSTTCCSDDDEVWLELNAMMAAVEEEGTSCSGDSGSEYSVSDDGDGLRYFEYETEEWRHDDDFPNEQQEEKSNEVDLFSVRSDCGPYFSRLADGVVAFLFSFILSDLQWEGSLSDGSLSQRRISRSFHGVVSKLRLLNPAFRQILGKSGLLRQALTEQRLRRSIDGVSVLVVVPPRTREQQDADSDSEGYNSSGIDDEIEASAAAVDSDDKEDEDEDNNDGEDEDENDMEEMCQCNVCQKRRRRGSRTGRDSEYYGEEGDGDEECDGRYRPPTRRGMRAARSLANGALGTSLRALVLAHCDAFVDDAALVEVILPRCPRLAVLSVAHCEKVSDASLIALATTAPCRRTIRSLDVSACMYHAIGSAPAFSALATSCTRLRTLHARYAAAVTAASFRAAFLPAPLMMNAAATSRPSSFFLQDVALGYCDKVTDECLELLAAAAARFGKFVRCLDVSSCPKVTVGGLARVLIPKSTLLSAASLDSFEKVDGALRSVENGQNCLKILDVSGCDGVVMSDLASLLEVSAHADGAAPTSVEQPRQPQAVGKTESSTCDLKKAVGISRDSNSTRNSAMVAVLPAAAMRRRGEAALSSISSCRLQSAILTDCYTLNDDAFLRLVGAHGSTLEHLDISFKLVPSPVVSTAALLSAVPQLPSLVHLNLSFLEHVTDAVIEHIALYCPSLEELRLACCVQITDRAVLALAEAPCAAHIKILNFQMDDRLTDSAIRAIAQHCSCLQELDAAFLRLLTDESVDALVTGCTQLERLSLHGCSEITKVALMRIYEVWDEQAAARSRRS